jgi:hypothetical protein
MRGRWTSSWRCSFDEGDGAALTVMGGGRGRLRRLGGTCGPRCGSVRLRRGLGLQLQLDQVLVTGDQTLLDRLVGNLVENPSTTTSKPAGSPCERGSSTVTPSSRSRTPVRSSRPTRSPSSCAGSTARGGCAVARRASASGCRSSRASPGPRRNGAHRTARRRGIGRHRRTTGSEGALCVALSARPRQVPVRPPYGSRYIGLACAGTADAASGSDSSCGVGPHVAAASARRFMSKP